MSDATDTMSVQLVCCVSPTPSGVRLGTFGCTFGSGLHAHGALASRLLMMLLLLLAVLSFHCRRSQLRHCRDRSWRYGGPTRRAIGVMVRQ